MLITISLPELFAFQNYFHWGVVSLFAFRSLHLMFTRPSRVCFVKSLNSSSWDMTLRSAASFIFLVLISPRNIPCLFSNVVYGVWVLVLLLFVHCGIYGHPWLIKNSCMLIYNKWNMFLKVHWLRKGIFMNMYCSGETKQKLSHHFIFSFENNFCLTERRIIYLWLHSLYRT